MEKSCQFPPTSRHALDLADDAIRAFANAVKKHKADSQMIQKVVGKPGVLYGFYKDLLSGRNFEWRGRVLRKGGSGKQPSFAQALEVARILNRVIARVLEETKAGPEMIIQAHHKSQAVYVFFDRLFEEEQKPKALLLTMLNHVGDLLIECTDGLKTISRSAEVFDSYIDPDFAKFDKPGPATAETALQVFEANGVGTYECIFTGVNLNLDRLVVSQAQIVAFCQRKRGWITEHRHFLLFLTKQGEEYSVVEVFADPHGLVAYSLELGGKPALSKDHKCYVVKPEIPVSVPMETFETSIG